MDEDPKIHNFNQRHDGPFDQPRPSAQITRLPPLHTLEHERRTVSQPTSLTSPASVDSPPVPSRKDGLLGQHKQKHRDSPPPRKSLQIPAYGDSRPSRDFDIRRDGPYGRPSLTMTRRRSSGNPSVLLEASRQDDLEARRPSITDLQQEGGVTLDDRLEAAFEPEPPPLSYSLWKRKWAIIAFWTLILVDCVAMPVGLYFGLTYGTDLSPNIVFSVVTAALGGVSIFEYFLRFWRLFRKNSNCRVIGARRMYLDWFHWNFSLGWVIIMIELIVGTVPEYPPIRLLAMPVSSMLFAFGTELLIVDLLRYFRIPAPIRISSIPRGAQLRPGIYSVIEDVCAVDGSGGTAFREALNKRYEASHVFRAMLRRLGGFWAFGAEAMATLTTILVFTIPAEAAYVVGWSAPFVWAGVWALITYFYVVKKLKEEKRAWAEEIDHKLGTVASSDVVPASEVINLATTTSSAAPVYSPHAQPHHAQEDVQDEKRQIQAVLEDTNRGTINTTSSSPPGSSPSTADTVKVTPESDVSDGHQRAATNS